MKKNCGMSVKGTTTIKRTKQTNMKTSQEPLNTRQKHLTTRATTTTIEEELNRREQSRCQDENVISVSICSQIFHFPCLFLSVSANPPP